MKVGKLLIFHRRNQLIKFSAVLFLLTTCKVVAGPAVRLHFQHCHPDPIASCPAVIPVHQLGKPAGVFLVARGSDGRIATNYTGTVEFSSSDISAKLPPKYTFRMSDKGVTSVTTTFYTSGETVSAGNQTQNIQTLTVIDSANGIGGLGGFYILGPPWQIFVKRFYTEALGRESNALELTSWVQKLDYRRQSVANVAQGILLSQEFMNRGLSHSDYVDSLYRALLDREADSTGRNSWLLQLGAGTDRSTILKGVLGSPEFSDLSSMFGILNPGLGPTFSYVARFHQQALPIAPDRLPHAVFEWSRELTNFSRTGADMAFALFLSRGFVDRNLSDQEFILVLYQAFFGREADEAGLNFWLAQLASGRPRPRILEGFLKSEEFAALAVRYEFKAN